MPTTAAISPADTRELSTWQVMALSAVRVPLTGSTAETTLATVSLPGGTLGPNGRLRITSLWSYTNNANLKNPRVKFGGTQFFLFGGSTQQSMEAITIIRNRNAQNSQVAAAAVNQPTMGPGNAPVLTAAIDTSASQNILFTGQLAVGTDTIALEAYLIEAMYAP